jgi:predicted permease
MLTDIRFAARILLKRPWLSLVAVVSLAFGIGANLTAFGITRTILWLPLPVPQAERLIAVYNFGSQGTGGYSGLSIPEYEYFRAHNDVLSGLAAYLRVPVFLRTAAQTERTIAELVTANYFAVVSPAIIAGRSFTTDAHEVVISQDLWTSRFAGAVDAIGARLYLGGYPYTIVGVVDRQFRGILMDWQEPPDLWIPIATMPQALPGFFRSPNNLLTAWNAHSSMVVGRLKPGVTRQQAAAAFEVLDQRMSEDSPERLRAWKGTYDFKPRILPVQRARFFPAYRDDIVNYIQIVGVVMAIVLGITSLNLANLVIAGALPRQKEFAVRAAIGAGRYRLLRQLMTEGLLLSLLGGAAGLLVASFSWRLLPLFGRPFRVALPPELPVGAPIWAVTLGLSLLTGILFSMWPARHACRFDLNAIIKQHSRSSGVRFRLRWLLIGAQVALSVVLVVGAALLVQTVRNARSVDATVERNRIGVVEIDVFSAGYNEQRAAAFFDDLLAAIRATPGVDHAGLVSTVPLGGRRGTTEVTWTPDGAAAPATMQVDDNLISTDYFDTIGLSVVRGRDFSAADRPGAPYTAIVNETMARQFWPNEDALGRRIFVGRADQSLEIVGVVKDAKGRNIRTDIQPTVFRSAAQFPATTMNLLFHSAAAPSLLLPELTQAARRLDPDVPIANFRTMQEHVDQGISQERLTAALLTAMGGIALGLTLIGLYGLVTFSTAARSREIGIRMAIGAQRRDVLRLVLRQSLVIVAIGLAAGAVGALFLTRVLSTLLFGVQAFDVISFGVAALLIGGTTALAAFVPSWRATRIDPVLALRQD